MNVQITKHEKEKKKIIVQKEVIEGFVESESKKGMFYKVTYDGDIWRCTCPQSSIKLKECKHIDALSGDIDAQ